MLKKLAYVLDILLRQKLQQVFPASPVGSATGGHSSFETLRAIDVIKFKVVDRLLQHVPPHDTQRSPA